MSTFNRNTVANIGQDYATIMTATKTTTIIGFSIANILNDMGATATVALVSLQGEYTHVVKNAPVPMGSSLVVVGGDQKLVLVPGDSLRIKSDKATSLDAIVSILEI